MRGSQRRPLHHEIQSSQPGLARLRHLRSPGRGPPRRAVQWQQAALLDRAGSLDVLRALVGTRLHHDVRTPRRMAVPSTPAARPDRAKPHPPEPRVQIGQQVAWGVTQRISELHGRPPWAFGSAASCSVIDATHFPGLRSGYSRRVRIAAGGSATSTCAQMGIRAGGDDFPRLARMRIVASAAPAA